MVSRPGSPSADIWPPRPEPTRTPPSQGVGVFRRRQAVRDLVQIVLAERVALERFALPEVKQSLLELAEKDRALRLSIDPDLHSNVLLAAALPDEDYPAFTTATGILLIEMLQNSHAKDDLFWNWDSFKDHYRLADPRTRAGIMNGFRTIEELGFVALEKGPNGQDCLTKSEAEIEQALQMSKQRGLKPMLNVSAKDAGTLWSENTKISDPVALACFRYLYERPASMEPASPSKVALIPWAD